MVKILVIGESCRDVFVYCDANRLAPDVPVPVLNIVDRKENDGMAKNVQRNILNYIDDCDIITNDNWLSISKTRYVHNATNHMFFRVDNEPGIELLSKQIDYDKYDIIVISDYNKGFLSESKIEEICQSHPRVFLDTKKPLGTWADSAFIIKINDYEYTHSDPEYTRNNSHRIIHTMGGEGCEFNGNRYPVVPVEVKDSSGAGDAFLAALIVDYAGTQNIDESIEFANYHASRVVRERGVTTI